MSAAPKPMAPVPKVVNVKEVNAATIEVIDETPIELEIEATSLAI